MPKITIKKEDLPPISIDDSGYNLRMRLISQDRNRSSFWTPLITILAPAVTEIPYVIKKDSSGIKTLNVIWEDPNKNKEYDVYVKWYITAGDTTASWAYKGSTFSNNYSLITPTVVHSYQVSVQKTTYPKEYAQVYSLFTSPVENV